MFVLTRWLPNPIKLTNFFLKDSGQAIPLVVESCIRYINLYGKLNHGAVFSVFSGVGARLFSKEMDSNSLGRFPVTALLPRGDAQDLSECYLLSLVCQGMEDPGTRKTEEQGGHGLENHQSSSLTPTWPQSSVLWALNAAGISQLILKLCSKLLWRKHSVWDLLAMVSSALNSCFHWFIYSFLQKYFFQSA